jgi:hypothetical protein
VSATGGGSVFVLTDGGAVWSTNLSVDVLHATSGATVAAATFESSAGGLVLVADPGGLSPAPYRLAFRSGRAGAEFHRVNDKAVIAVTPTINSPELLWWTPRARAADQVAIYGRRFRPISAAAVTLTLVQPDNLNGTSGPHINVSAFVENENRATFVLPLSLTTPGVYVIR